MKNIGEYTFDPSKLRILHPKNDKGKRIRLSTEEMVAKYPSYKAFMAAPMWNHTGQGICRPGGLTPCTRQYDSATAVDYPSCRPKSGISFSVFSGDHNKTLVAPLTTNTFALGCTLGIQLYPTLVFSGINKGKTEKPSSVAGLGLLPSGQFLSVVASGASLKDLGEHFLSKGCNYAGYTDAGSSAALYVVGEGYRGIHAKKPFLPAWLAVDV